MPKKKTGEIPSDERLELLFRHAGLSEKQAKLYRLLLITGEERPSTLSKKSGIKRGNTYALLEDLTRHGLVQKFERGGITYFTPEPPHKLGNLVEARQREALIASELAHDLLPNLTSQYKAAIDRPVVRAFEGKEDMETVFEDIYGPHGKDNIVWGCADIERVHTEFPDKLKKKLIPLRHKNDWTANSIFVDNPGGIELHRTDASQKRVSCVVDGTQYPLPAEIDVYDDKITFMNFEKEDFVGLIIENPQFAETLRSIFKLAFAYTQEHCKHKESSSLP